MGFPWTNMARTSGYWNSTFWLARFINPNTEISVKHKYVIEEKLDDVTHFGY